VERALERIFGELFGRALDRPLTLLECVSLSESRRARAVRAGLATSSAACIPARAQPVLRVRQSLLCRQRFIHPYPDASPLGTFHPDTAANLHAILYSAPIQAAAPSRARPANEAADHAPSTLPRRAHQSCLLQRFLPFCLSQPFALGPVRCGLPGRHRRA